MSRLVFTALVLSLLSLAALVPVLGQNCTFAPTCSSTPAIVPTAWFNLTFPANVSTSTSYRWAATDAAETGCPFVHRGLATFSGGTAATGGQYVNLNAAVGAATSSGQAPLPPIIGGAGSGRPTDGTAGWSFEWTARSSARQAGNAKIFSIGAGEAVWNIFAGPDGSGNGEDFGVYGGNGNYANGASGILNIINPVLTTQWYHAVVVVQNLTDSFASDDGAAWFVYINGQLLNYTGRGVYLNSKDIQPVARPTAYLGRSSWAADPYWTGLLDTFRIYDKALTGSQVQTLYQGEMGGCPVPTQSTPIDNVVSTPNILPRTAASFVAPIYSLPFDTNPCAAGLTCNYGWERVSPMDDASQQAIHKGILRINMDGAKGHYADMAATSGPLAVSSTALPMIGGLPSTTNPGWSFELVVKPNGIVNWGKVFDIGAVRSGQTTCNNDILLGWDATNAQWQFDTCDARGREFQTGDAFGNVPSVWAHMVIVISPVLPFNGLANYFSYLNGDLYTAEANFPLPPAVVREMAWLGRSGWQGADANFSGEIDLFNIYNVAVSDIQVSLLYRQNFLNQTVTWGPSGGGGDDVSAAGSSNKSLSDGAIAGIVIGSVVGALLLLVLCVVFVCTRSRAGGKKAGSTDYSNQQDVSQIHSTRDHDEGEHETGQHEDVEMA